MRFEEFGRLRRRLAVRFEYRVIEVPPDTCSLQSALDEYGHAGWELVAFEMGELQAPRMIFKKGTSFVP